jgi:hypothetical protein
VGDSIYGGTGNVGHLFRCDTTTDLCEDLGQPMPGWNAIPSLLEHHGKIYGGTGTYGLDAHLFEYDPDAPPGDEVTDLGAAVAGEDYIYSLAAIDDGKIYGGTGWDGHFFIYDLSTGTFDDLGWDAPGEGIYALVGGPDGRIYGGSRSGYLFCYDPVQNKFVDLGQPSPGEYYVRSLAFGTDGLLYGGTGSERGWLFAYDPILGETTHYGRADWGTNTIRGLASGADGTLYGAGTELFSLQFANPSYAESGQAVSVGIIPAVSDLGQTPFTTDVYTLQWHQGMLYGGGYSGYLLYLDPELGMPLQRGRPVPDENRINVMASGGDGKLYGGTGGFSWTSGHLFSYDPLTHVSQDLGKIAPLGDYDVSALASAGTVLYAGSGSHAHFLIYDIGTGNLVDKGEAVVGEYAITGLVVGPAGAVYGLTWPLGHLFTYDAASDTLSLLWSYPDPDIEYSESAITAAPNGLIYFSVGVEGRLYALDPVMQQVADLGRPVSDATAIAALVPFGSELYGAANVDRCGDTRTVLFALDPSTGDTRQIGQPLAYEPRVNCLAGGGDVIFGGTGLGDGRFFAYDTGYEFEWGRLVLTATVPSGTEVHVDVRGGDGSLLVPDAGHGQSLAAIDPYRHPSLELVARLSTADTARTPAVEAWGVTWPPIRVLPSELLVLLRPEDPDVVTRTLSLRPTASVPVTWTTDSDASWLHVAPLSGTLPATVTVALDKTGLEPGTYSATVAVAWTAPDEVGIEPVHVILGIGDYSHVYLPCIVR